MQIDASKDRVWEILGDLSGINKWTPLVVSSTATTKPAANTYSIGCERSCEIQGMGSIQERVTEWNEGYGFTVEIKPIPGTPVKSGLTTWSLESQDNNQIVVKVTSNFRLDGTEKEKKGFLLQQAPQLFKSCWVEMLCRKQSTEGSWWVFHLLEKIWNE